MLDALIFMLNPFTLISLVGLRRLADKLSARLCDMRSGDRFIPDIAFTMAANYAFDVRKFETCAFCEKLVWEPHVHTEYHDGCYVAMRAQARAMHPQNFRFYSVPGGILMKRKGPR